MSVNRGESQPEGSVPSKRSEAGMRHDQSGEFDYGVEGRQSQQHGPDSTQGTGNAENSTLPERKDPKSPSTSHEYPNGNRGVKSGKNLEQQAQASGTPGGTGGRQPNAA